VKNLNAAEEVSTKVVKTGRVDTETVTSSSFEVANTDSDARTIGTATIPAGETSVTVETKAVTKGSRIFVTPEVPILFGVKKDTRDESFTVTLSEPADKDTSFSWWVIEESTPALTPEP